MAGAEYPGFFPPGTAAGGTVFSAERQRDFSRFREVAFRQLGAGQEAGRYVPFGKKDIPERASGSVCIRFGIFPRFQRSGQAGGPAPWPARFQYRLPRKGQVNRGLKDKRPGPSAPLPQGPSGQRNPVARLAGTARFLVHRRTPNGPVKMQKNLGR
ncbi:hypothetical protein Cdeb_00542 [Caldibacillus debilis GB1]|jgi:hypothetical protein|uniref:Uncharacterized protein n=1 Tax=Caldibacillus debilis GB1 TaxID=1339248 RepID=A0A420VHG5_9BACI|nr:hypothetical protein Cdeb_00542 [Caldibacillus debilis GB1]